MEPVFLDIGRSFDSGPANELIREPQMAFAVPTAYRVSPEMRAAA
jgi:hypothetical protein